MQRQDLRDAFLRNGFVAARNLLDSAAVGRLQQDVAEVGRWPDDSQRWMHHWEQTPSGPRLARTENFSPFHPRLLQLIVGGLLSEFLEELIGEPVSLYKEKINYKFPGGGGYAPHQDAPAYDHTPWNVTVNLAVDPATRENGCLWFHPGAWERLLPMDAHGCIAAEAMEGWEWTPMELAPGDALVFHSFAPHYSAENASQESRRSLYLTYNRASDGDHREQYYSNRRRMLNASVSGQRISKIGHFQGRVVQAPPAGSEDSP